jgi:hypothetical protein
MDEASPIRQAIAAARKQAATSLLQYKHAKTQAQEAAQLHVLAPAKQASALFRTYRRSHTVELIGGFGALCGLLGVSQGRFGVFRNVLLGSLLGGVLFAPEWLVRVVGRDPFAGRSTDCADL